MHNHKFRGVPSTQDGDRSEYGFRARAFGAPRNDVHAGAPDLTSL
jgi:hypothetical protein